MFDMFNALSCRSADKSVFALGLLTNKFFCYAVGGSLLGQLAVVYFPPLQVWKLVRPCVMLIRYVTLPSQAIFQTVSLSFGDWVYVTSIASTVLWVDELRKALAPEYDEQCVAQILC